MQGHNHRKMLAATFAGLRYLKIWVRPMQLHRLPVVTFLLLYTVNMKHHNLIDLMRKYCLFIVHPSVFPLKIMVTKSQMMVIIKLQHIIILHTISYKHLQCSHVLYYQLYFCKTLQIDFVEDLNQMKLGLVFT